MKRFFKKNTHNQVFKMLAGLGRSMNRLYENRNHDIQSNGELVVIEKLAAIKPSVLVDGGANIGGHSLMLQKLIPDAQIFAFEPVGETYKKLCQQVEQHRNITPVNKGLYSENCEKEINLFDSHTHSSLFEIEGVSYSPNSSTTIELVTGDTFMKEREVAHIDFLKLDVEGAEFSALKGFEENLSQGKITAIQFEYGYINITTKKLLIDFYNLLETHGYIVGKIFPKTVEFRAYDFKHEDFIGPNFIAVKKEEKALIELLKNP